MEFDTGTYLSEIQEKIKVQLGDSDGNLTDNIVAPPVRGLLMTRKLIQALEDNGVDNIQIFPASLLDKEGVCVSEEYSIVNILDCIRAVDMDASDVEIHPDFPDEIEFINSLVLDTSAVSNQMIFRLAENTQIIVVDEKIKSTIETRGLSGVKFLAPEDYFI
jgi:hypothetical protein